MATITDYPDGLNTAGPYILRLIDLPTEFVVDRMMFEDGGCDVNVQPCGPRRWKIEYGGLSASEVSTLVAHFNSAKGSVNDFSFYDRRAAATFSQVYYDSFKLPEHVKKWNNPVSVVLRTFQ